ncbi:hypothetical protein TRFO_29919 [Tritrichomonas foetus]|uniref:Uncharacterized protein n=1 Tax=Tritrichomonas foetus TaxID=1144522 RepID=A0A1J4JZC3_9EUKA|nr:hypothetical protein TRFO_29919 [Tritrichomonas foetus]|eukprot:OHT02846.1 hypothetical protein TRFO_29919 [Tritrichomonas foetus]
MPFIVIKPLYKSQTDNSFIVNTRNSIKNNSVLSNTLNNGLDDSLNHSSFIEYVDDKENDLFDELSNSVRAFFDQMGIVFDTDWSKTPLLQGLEDIANCVNNALLEYKEMAQNIEYLERQARVDKIKIEEFQKGDLKVTSLNAEIFELKMRIKEKEKEIEELKEIPDPYPLRDALLKLGQMFALKYKMNFNCDQETDCDEIIDTFENIIKEGPKIESETEKIEKVINKLKKITKIEDQNLDEQLLKADQAVSEIIQENENLKQQILLATQKLETSLIKAKVDIPKEKNLDAFVEALDTKILSLINLLKKKTRDFANDQIEYKGYLTKIHYILSNKEVEDNPDQICKTIINNLKKWKNDMEDKDQTIQNKESEVKAQALKLSRFLKFIKKLIEIDFTEYDGIETYQFAIQNEINSLRGKNELLNIKINEINKHLNTYSEKLNFDPNDSVISKIELIINQFNDQNSLIAGLEEENENIRKTLVATTNSLGRLLPTATIVSWETKIDDLMKIADSLAISPDASKPVIQKEKVNEILGYSEGDAEANLRAIAVRIKINDSSMKVMNQFNNAFHEISNSLRSSQGNGFASLMGSVAKMSSLFSGLNPSLADQITYSFLSQSVSLVEAMSRHILDFHQ